MVNALDRTINKFRCYYTGIILEEYQTKSPFYLTFDHIIPGDNSKLVCCARFINELKTSQSEAEFKTNIPLLADHFELGTPIDKSTFKLEYFNKFTRKTRKLTPAEPPDLPTRIWKSDVCVVCGKEPGDRSLFCSRCRRFLLGQFNRAACRAAMVQAYDKEIDGFRCHYTGVVIETEDGKSPWYFSFDHRFPDKSGNLAISAIIINDMKTELADYEFIAVVKQLAKHFTTGEPFDLAGVKFEYWVRPRAILPA
jgi:hypothetical protein